MFSERSVRIPLLLPKVDGTLKYNFDQQETTSRNRINSIKVKEQKKITRQTFHQHTYTSSPFQLQLYTPMQESKRAARLKNMPYNLEYFIPNLPNKNFKSSHLMNDDLKKKQKDLINNHEKWQLKTYINSPKKIFSVEKKEKEEKLTERAASLQQIMQKNAKYIENQKKKRIQQYKKTTQSIIDQFSERYQLRIQTETNDF